MADEEHVARLKQGVKVWNAWRGKNPTVEPNLRGVNRREAILSGANLSGANLSRADLSGANLSNTLLQMTVFGDTNLTGVRGLETCRHGGPSIIDHRTLQKSEPLPLVFLRGMGLPDNLIEYLPSLLNQPIQFYSCFISYSSKDQEFAERLYTDLQNKGVRCWFAPHDMRTGALILDTIGDAIRHRDKVLIILSEASVSSKWVEHEVKNALAEEHERDQTILFPIRLDDAVKEAQKEWARLLRRERHITDFTRWKDHNNYRKSFEQALRDLTVVQESSANLDERVVKVAEEKVQELRGPKS